MAAILYFFKWLYLSYLKGYIVEIWNLSYLPPNLLLGPILTLILVDLVWQVCLWWPPWIFSKGYISAV